MAPTILIAGATGNTGRSVTETLPRLLKTSKALSDHRILALTRSLDSPAAKAFIASHNNPNQFAEETTFHVAALEANVKYVVRISTTAAAVRPNSRAYYQRAHWAIEALLSTPEFESMQWTSLQPNIFSQYYRAPAVEFIEHYRQTKEQGTLRLMGSEDAPVGIIDPDDVGTFAAHLLALEDPADITGAQIVEMIEQRTGTKVEDVIFRDVSFLDSYYEHNFAKTGESKNVILSLKRAVGPVWDGKCTSSTTSREVLEIAAPRRTPIDVLNSMLAEQ
ncbi:hypothetical protein BJX63DRAFT_442706 [Aspergillus granulosus]|uniref:NmrA-like domain-containing protein n=1 Tax=Aspergillus granulosus TaxID=176169 RepID=A0ABR4HGZ7_9EURO